MYIEEIKRQLCAYDNRNPDYDKDYPKKDKHKECYCDSCFYGRHYLADELLRVLNALEDANKALSDMNLG